jgi:hypothetical protein
MTSVGKVLRRILASPQSDTSKAKLEREMIEQTNYASYSPSVCDHTRKHDTENTRPPRGQVRELFGVERWIPVSRRQPQLTQRLSAGSFERVPTAPTQRRSVFRAKCREADAKGKIIHVIRGSRNDSLSSRCDRLLKTCEPTLARVRPPARKRKTPETTYGYLHLYPFKKFIYNPK